jgi:hypothetical protein
VTAFIRVSRKPRRGPASARHLSPPSPGGRVAGRADAPPAAAGGRRLGFGTEVPQYPPRPLTLSDSFTGTLSAGAESRASASESSSSHGHSSIRRRRSRYSVVRLPAPGPGPGGHHES